MPARIIFKAHYLSGKKSGHIENYIEYMGTRPGVEVFDDDGSPATEKQKQLIEQLLEDCGKGMSESFEYEDYLLKPTKANASAAITACLDGLYGDTATKENYIDYIANRPRVEKLGEHGLFSQTDAPIDLRQTAEEVAHQGNNVWTNIISLNREDATTTGFDNASAWRDLLRSKVETIARNYKIPIQDFVWYAAFHNEGHHPHVHFVCYSKGKDGFLTDKAIENIKSSLAHEIFRQEFSEIYSEQQLLRTNIKDEGTQLIDQLARNLASGAEKHENEELLKNIVNLKARLDTLTGKKQYGYLPKDAKALVDDILEKIAGHESIAKLYELWYEQKEELSKIYKSNLPSRLPLSENKEFTSIKNVIIREVDNLSLSTENLSLPNINIKNIIEVRPSAETNAENLEEIALFDDLGIDVFSDFEKDLLSLPETDFFAMNTWESAIPYPNDADAPFAFPDDMDAPPDIYEPFPSTQPQDANGKPYIAWSKNYEQARLYLFGNNDVNRDFEKAFQLFTREATAGNALAMYDLGKMHADGLGIKVDAEKSTQWYSKAFQAFNSLETTNTKHATHLQYRIGKMYDAGLGTQQDYAKAAQWYTKAVKAEHKYAEYSLASLYARGNGLAQDLVKAFDLYHRSADQNNPYACYELAKMFRDGIGTNSDPQSAEQYFQSAFQGFSNMEAEMPDDKLEYRLGQMLHTGTGTEPDDAAAEVLFEKSATAGNVYAQYSLAMLWLHDNAKDAGKAVALLQKASDNGNAMAQYALGKLYFEGSKPVQKDIDKALNYLQKATAQNNPFAQYTLGKIYLDGNGVKKDLLKAEKLLLQSAEQGNAFAAYRYGCLLREFYNSEKDALEWIQKAADADHPGALYTLCKENLQNNSEAALSYLRRLEKMDRSENSLISYYLGKLYLMDENKFRNTALGLAYLSESANQGNDMELYTLGKTFLDGKYLPKNIYLSLSFLEKAAKLQNSYAEYQLGRLFICGIDVPQNIEKGLKLLQASASQENESALYLLGKLYLSGELVPQDIDEAVNYLQHAATMGNSFAHYHLGKLYLNGELITKDIMKAFLHLEKAVALENDAAMYTLGALYLNGDDVLSKNADAAVSYFEKAAEKGNTFAQFQIGKMLLLGSDVPQNITRGLSYLEQAVAGGNDTAMLFLGQAYLSGTNVPKNIEKGLELLRASAAQGNAYASKTLEGFYAGAAHTAIAVLYKLSMILRGNTAAMTAKSPVMPAVDRKEWLSILRKKAEQGIRYD